MSFPRSPLQASTWRQTIPKVPFRFSRLSSTLSSLINIHDIPAAHRGCIRVLSLNNPRSRNAISRSLLADLARNVESIHNESSDGLTRALIIASDVDEAFCAGADLKERSTFTLEETKDFLTSLRSTFTSISRLPIPTIAAISSLALGGGLELALCTHLRVFTSNALVALPESRLAIVPGAGGTFRLPAIIGRTRALDMMLTGRRINGRQAEAWGLCDRMVDMEEVGRKNINARGAREKALEAAIEVAEDICRGGPVATRALLQCVGRGQDEENEAYGQVLETMDRTEALQAFAEKRSPRFTGH